MSAKPKHKLVAKYIPKEFQELADSAYDHIGEIIAKIDPLEFSVGMFGAFSVLKHTSDFEAIFLGFISGMAAARGLQSRSEAVGIASIATLTGLGILAFNRDIMGEAGITHAPPYSDEERKAIYEAWRRAHPIDIRL